MKEIFAPHLGRNVKLGRKIPSAYPKLQLHNYAKLEVLPPPPDGCDYTANAAASLSNVYANDVLGDCTIAGIAHIQGIWTGNSVPGNPFIWTEQQIIKAYSDCGGYVVGDPSTDNGCDEQTVLNYFLKNGMPDGSPLAGWLGVNAKNEQLVKLACFWFENLYFGLSLPDAWISPFPAASGFTWNNAAPDYNNGHCVAGGGYTPLGVKIATWGLLGLIAWDAVSALAVPEAGGQLYVLVSQEMLVKGQQTAPNGLDWSALAADFNSIGGSLQQAVQAPAQGS